MSSKTIKGKYAAGDFFSESKRVEKIKSDLLSTVQRFTEQYDGIFNLILE